MKNTQNVTEIQDKYSLSPDCSDSSGTKWKTTAESGKTATKKALIHRFKKTLKSMV